MSRPIPIRRMLWPIALACLFQGHAAFGQTPIVSGQVYTLVAKTSGLALDNEGGLVNNPVWQWTPTPGNTNQQWRFIATPDGHYQLVCLTSGAALDNGGSGNDGVPTTETVPAENDLAQEWSFVSVGSGYYQLINAESGKALDNSGATTIGGSVWQWDANPANTNQQWLIAPVQIGANTPFTSYEAETGTLGGGASVISLVTPRTTEFSSPELEASGHSFVHLAATGQSVSWTNTTGHPVTFVNVRYSIPDAPTGGGINSTLDVYVNGVLRQALPVNSRQTWVYETQSDYDSMNQDPSYGSPHVFWDESHAFLLGAPVAPGDTITLQKDSANSAAFHNIDVVDLEQPPAPLAQPAGSLSIASCGAVANDITKDSSAAIQSCIDQAQSQGSILWIPQGTFYLNTAGSLRATGITIEGAGMWYSTVYYNPPLPNVISHNVFLPTSASLRNFAIDGNATSEAIADGNGGPINIKGSNWVIDSMWIQHEGPAIWADGANGLVQNNRINNSWADGINLNNGNGDAGNNTGNNFTALNNFVRGTGDDGMAINDSLPSLGMTNITVMQNTIVAPWWGNDIGIYGGTNDIVANNLTLDSVKDDGISIGIFGAQGGPIGSATIEGNIVLRGGSFGYGVQRPAIGVGVTGPLAKVNNVLVRGNTASNAMFNGVEFNFGNNAILADTIVDAPGLDGFVVDPGAQGSAQLFSNTLENLKPGQSGFVNQSPSTYSVSGSNNVGFTLP